LAVCDIADNKSSCRGGFRDKLLLILFVSAALDIFFYFLKFIQKEGRQNEGQIAIRVVKKSIFKYTK
jgi:hypothetical protein